MNIDIEKYLKDKGLFKTVVEDYNPYIVADLMEMYAKKYHEDQLNNLSQHLVIICFVVINEEGVIESIHLTEDNAKSEVGSWKRCNPSFKVRVERRETN